MNLKLTKHLIASGTVRVTDGFNACRSHVTVKIQHLKDGNWKSVGTDQTASDGTYKKVLADETGKYRAIAQRKAERRRRRLQGRHVRDREPPPLTQEDQRRTKGGPRLGPPFVHPDAARR